MNKLQQYQLLSAIAAVAILLSGCGDSHPKRVPVSGRVLIDGKPVETGYIQLVPAEDCPATGTLGRGGRFTLTTFDEGDGCVLGQHRVAVTAREQKGLKSVLWLCRKNTPIPRLRV